MGWSMQSQMQPDIVLKALLMVTVWPKKTREKSLSIQTRVVRSDWQDFLKTHNLICSMSRRGNCYDNAVAESFFQLLKRERIKKKIYKTREAAKSDIFNYIKIFYNSKRRHGFANDLAPSEFEKNCLKKRRYQPFLNTSKSIMIGSVNILH